MNQFTFSIFQKTDSLSLLRLLDREGKLIAERELDGDAVNGLAALVDDYYRRNTPKLAEIGARLYRWLDGPSERWLARESDGPAGTAVYVDVVERLRHLPWELLNDQGRYLCHNAFRPFTPIRLAAKSLRPHQRENRPLRILFMACSAEDIKPVLQYEHEESSILKSAGKYDIELVVEERGSVEGLAERLTLYGDDGGKGYFDVLHLTGHADVNDENEPIFWMENDLGFGVAVTANSIARSFAGNWPRLVFLSGCKTAQSSEAGLLPSFCEKLVEAGAPAVLGWALPVGDLAATEVAAELYEHLAAGKRIDEAVARARQHLAEAGSDDWHLLRLYADRTPPAEVVTPPHSPKRARIRIRPARNEFLDENSRSEVCPREEFIGRRRPLQRCLRVLVSRPDDPHYAEGVLLHGMGGLGKSSLAARLCDRLPEHRRLVWYAAIDELAFASKLGDKLADIEVNQILNQPLPLRQRLRRMLECEAFERPALFVFDDFEQNLDADGGGYRVKPDALEILTGLLRAIRETGSPCRVIVTSRYRFPLPHPLSLYEESLESLSDADLAKKLRQLDEKFDLRLAAGDARLWAEQLGAGNPRLLERLYRLIADAGTDHRAIFAAIAQTTDEFREEILLRQLLDRQSADCRRLVALAGVCRLPVDRAAIAAIAAEAAVDPHLERAVTLGLIESGVETDPATGAHSPRYFVSNLLLPLLDRALAPDEAQAATGRAARHLHQQWWVERDAPNIEQALEVHRLALLAAEKEIAVEICDRISTAWTNRSQYREAMLLCRATLTLGDDYRILLCLARAEKVLGIGSPVEHYQQALAECPEADFASRSSILFNYAEIVAQQGDVKRALELWQQSLSLKEQIGDVKGKA
ncbi:MAG: CHAT domain-containing protein, partial [Blastocatellia bacterium]